MKNRINLWLVMFLAISLALPTYSMAQTTPTLTLESYTTGDRISGGPIKTFSMGPDGSLVVYLDGPFNFTDLYPDISLNDTAGSYTPSSLVVTKPASVTATQPAAGTSFPIKFKVTSATANATLSLVVDPVDPERRTLPASSSSPFTFPEWDIGGSTPAAVGSYLAVFEASIPSTPNPLKSQLVVMINITPPGYTLTLNTVGDGTVTKNPAQDTYTTKPVQNVQLTPNAGSGYSFTGWSGDLSGSANPANIVMDSNKTVTATFTQTPPNQYTLTVNVSPSSSAGTVSLNPSGGSYTAGTQVALTANPSSNYTFSSWSGVDSSSGATASVTMGSTNKIVTANFTASSPPSTGDAWPWDTYPTFNLNAGEEKVYIVNINKNLIYLKLSIAGLNESTQAVFSWTFPDGSVYPQALNQGVVDIDGMNFGGLLVLRSKKYYWGFNINHDYIPQGNHVLRIKASAASYFKAMIDAY